MSHLCSSILNRRFALHDFECYLDMGTRQPVLSIHCKKQSIHNQSWRVGTKKTIYMLTVIDWVLLYLFSQSLPHRQNCSYPISLLNRFNRTVNTQSFVNRTVPYIPLRIEEESYHLASHLWTE